MKAVMRHEANYIVQKSGASKTPEAKVTPLQDCKIEEKNLNFTYVPTLKVQKRELRYTVFLEMVSSSTGEANSLALAPDTNTIVYEKQL